MKIHFTKMHGCGNDYIFVNLLDQARENGRPAFEDVIENAEKTAKTLSRRHFSVGSDGLVLILPSNTADARMKIYNADGSEGKMCGNALRCVGKLLYESGIARKSRLRIETESGIRGLFLAVSDKKVGVITADMGEGKMSESTVQDLGFELWQVNVGNDHAVCFFERAEDIEKLDIEGIGRELSKMGGFEERVNVEFCSSVGENRLRVRVFERGSGVTLACGTGACAAAFAAVKLGIASADHLIKIIMDGGELRAAVDENSRIYLTGSAEVSFEGVAEV